MTEIQDRIIGVLRAIGRPGTDAVIDYLLASNYFTRGCYGHHKCYGGLAKHSVEVYEYMLAHAGGFAADTLAVTALFHDLGKTVRRDGHGHGPRSVAILDRLGYPLTADERTAISTHHVHTPKAWAHPLRRALSFGDMDSTGRWKRAHRSC